MRIDKRLNLVIPVTRSDGAQIYVHSTPISSDVFDTYFLPISKAFAALYAEGLGVIAGPRIADKMLKKVSKDMGVWEGPDGVRAGLIAEINRLTNVFAVGKNGWEMMPLDDAKSKSVLEAADVSEVEAAITFFTLASSMHLRKDQEDVLGGAAKLWGAQISQLACTDYLNSLRTSTSVVSIGAKAAV